MARKNEAGKASERKSPPIWAGWAGLVVAAGLTGTGLGLYIAHVPHDINFLRGPAAGSPAVAFRTAVRWDLLALSVGALGLLAACFLGRVVFWTRGLHRWALVGIAASLAAFVLNAAHDGLLLIACAHGLRGSWVTDTGGALLLAKFSALLAGAIVGVPALATTLGRLAMNSPTRKHWESVRDRCVGTESGAPGTEAAAASAAAAAAAARRMVIPPPVIEVAASDGSRAPVARAFNQSWWQDLSTGSQTRWAQGFASPSERADDSVGICVSGGGIRSASVALGALQALRETKVLGTADYLVSVSGGGYTTAGIQLALTAATDGIPAGQAIPVTKATPADAFSPGSAEEDHLRRHSSYIAAGLRQWMVALGVLLRGVLSSLVVIGLTITTLGLALGGFYGYVPIAAGGDLATLLPRFAVAGKHTKAPPYPAIPLGIWFAIGAFAALALLTYLARQLAVRPAPARRISQIALALLAAAALLAVIGVVLPALLWASSWVTWPLGLGPLRSASIGSLTLVVTYLGAVVAAFWRKRTTIARSAGTVTGLAKDGPVNQVLPNSMIQMIIMWICLAFLILVALLLCGWAATSGLVDTWWALAPAGALVLLVIFVEQSSLSLHPFYRRRLASAFAVRRAEGPGAERRRGRRPGQPGADVAQPYADDEMTPLGTYAKPGRGFPAVTFAATANITGQDRTPPGRPAVPFMLAHDYIGGPATGWVRTDFLQALAGKRLRRDLTVEAAMAISGAAFASAMGGMTRFYEVFLAISNARLGAWLPNPYFVALKLERLGDWTIPGLPDRRRLSYFAREIFGIHPSTSRLLLCTDGGHYDNLGLVELLRRRCKRIYCIDASGAVPPLDDTLAGAITLAREELGVDIQLTDAAYDLVPGGRELMSPAGPFTNLNKRLSKSAVTIGSITYPEVPRRRTNPGDAPSRHKEATGELVFVQAVLTPGMPYQLLDFPQDDVGFPRDSTGDQWFNSAQFDAYQQLGHFIGQEAARRPAAAVGERPLPVQAPRARLRRRVRMIRLRHPRS